jgi:serine/threonine-protein kinase PknK
VVAQAGDAALLLDLVDQHTPDLAIVDIRMPPTFTTEGLEAARTIRQRFPSVAILVLSAFVHVDHALDLLSSGDRIGYLLKSHVTDITAFVDALEEIARGGSAIDPSLVKELVAAKRRQDPLRKLNSQERNVLVFMAEGRSNAGIAKKLGTAETAVIEQVRRVFTKLCLPETDAENRRAMILLAFLDAR